MDLDCRRRGSAIALAADFRLLSVSLVSFLFTKLALAEADMGSALLAPGRLA